MADVTLEQAYTAETGKIYQITMGEGQPKGNDLAFTYKASWEGGASAFIFEAVLTKALRCLCLSQRELVDVAAIGLRPLDGVEVSPVDVLHQRPLVHLPIGRISHQGWDAVEACHLGSPESALACDQLESFAGGPYNNWLNNPVGLDRFGQFEQLLLVPFGSGLMRVGPDL